METFGDRLKSLREDRKLSIRQLSAKTGLSDNVIGKWEKGTVQPSLENVKTLCKFFGVDMNYLTGWSD